MLLRFITAIHTMSRAFVAAARPARCPSRRAADHRPRAFGSNRSLPASSGSRRAFLAMLTALQSRGAAAAAATSQAQQVLEDPRWPEQWPFRADQFERFDESSDALFYDTPRFVAHIDDAAIAALRDFYAQSFPPPGPDVALLDICSSWICHYPEGYTAGRIAGLGMNEAELARNSLLTEFSVKDLNADPSLPFEDNSFDVVTNAVSVDYLVRPLEVFKEIRRVLRPGGLAIMSFSNRCFPTKAVSIWTSTGDLDHIWIVGSYFHYAGGFTAPEARDITKAGLFGKGDPMYTVTARKA